MRRSNATGRVYPASLRRNIRCFMAYRALTGVVGFSFPVVLGMWQRCGLEAAAMAELQAVFALALAVLSLGGGYFADRLSRRAALILGLLAFVVGECAYGMAVSFSSLLAAEMLLALALALLLGAEHAILYDWLKAAGLQDEHPRLRSRALQASTAVLIPSAALGAWVGKWDVRYPFFISAVGMTLAVLSVWRMRESQSVRSPVNHLAELLGIAREAFVEKPRLRWLIVFSGALFALSFGGFPLFQLYYEERGIAKEHFGWLIGGMNLFNLFCLESAAPLKNGLRPKAAFRLLIGMTAASYVLMGLVPSRYAVGLVLGIVFVRAFADVIFADYVNREVGPERRASLNSVQGALGRMLYAAMLLVLGPLAQGNGVSYALGFLGLVTLVVGGSLLAGCPPGYSGGEEG